MNFLISMLSEDGDVRSVSTMRVATLLVVLGVLVPRAIVAAKTGVIPEMTAQEIGLVLGALGLKAWQRGKEGNDKG